MVYHFVTVAKIYWLLFLVVPGTVHSGYLKSAGDIKILEGETCIIEWAVYNAEERVAPCSWWFSHNVSEEARLFLAYEDGKKYEFGKLGQWHFTNSKDPCKGGLEKKIMVEDAGVYSMQTEKGNLLMKEDAKTSVEVLKGSDLKFSVFVNDKVKTFNVSGGLEWTLEKLKTDAPVNVSVVLSKAFPPATVTITSNSGEGYCNDPYKGCHHLTDLKDMTDVSVLIKIKTGIMGASQITITQPVTYSPPVDKRHRIASIIFGLLFCVLLSFIIVMIILLIRSNRKARKQNVKEVEKNQGEKLKMSQFIRKKMKDNITDFTVAFKVNEQNKSDEVKNIFNGQEKCITDLEMKIRENVMSELTKCKKQVELAQSSVEDILNKSKLLMDTMTNTEKEMEESGELNQSQHEQCEITKLQIQRVREIENHLINCKIDLLSYDNKIKNFKHELKLIETEETEVGEEATEATEMIKEKEGVQHKDIQEQFQKILDMNSQLTKLQFASTEISRTLESINGRNTTLEDAASSIKKIKEHFEKIQKGWNFSKKGSDVDSSSVNMQGNKSKKETEEKSPKKKRFSWKPRNKSKKENEEKSPKKKSQEHKEEDEKKSSEM